MCSVQFDTFDSYAVKKAPQFLVFFGDCSSLPFPSPILQTVPQPHVPHPGGHLPSVPSSNILGMESHGVYSLLLGCLCST